MAVVDDEAREQKSLRRKIKRQKSFDEMSRQESVWMIQIKWELFSRSFTLKARLKFIFFGDGLAGGTSEKVFMYKHISTFSAAAFFCSINSASVKLS